MTENPKMPKFEDMTTDQKLSFILARVSTLDHAFGSYIKFNKHDEPFRKFFKEEQDAMQRAWEKRQDELKEQENKNKEKAKVEKIDKA